MYTCTLFITVMPVSTIIHMCYQAAWSLWTCIIRLVSHYTTMYQYALADRRLHSVLTNTSQEHQPVTEVLYKTVLS